jgi:hypothetical protein
MTKSCTLNQAFNDKAKRPLMFCDFIKNQENLDKAELLQKRRMVQQKINENCYRPKTHQDLLLKFEGMHDTEQYVKKIEDEARARGRVQKDRYMPNDKSKQRFWILDDEVMKFCNQQDAITMLWNADISLTN